MSLHKSLVFAVLLSLAGCATTAKYEAMLDGWLNRDINALIEAWGYPLNSMKLPNGNTVYIFESSNSYITPVQAYTTYHAVGDTLYADTNVIGGEAYSYWCRTFFEVDSSNLIRKWQVKGNSCVSR